MNQGMFANERCPHAEYISMKGFYIPSGLGISLEQCGRVAEVVKTVLVGE